MSGPHAASPKPLSDASQESMRAEFDKLADDYYEQHKANIAITGESPEFFSEYKVRDLAGHVKGIGLPVSRVLDFGSGIGNSIPYFRRHFAESRLSCADVSPRSMEIARARFPGNEDYLLIENGRLPVESGSQDVVFSECVFHHITLSERVHWLTELRRVTRKGGLLAIYEHNPLNPLTRRAVDTCPLDVNAHLIHARQMGQLARSGGWLEPRASYRLFFPAPLAKLRPLERHLGWCGLGAQYRLLARQPT